jgi:hypothetical protein
MDNLVDRLKKLPTCKYHVHETEVCRILHIKVTGGGVSVRGKLSKLLLALREGHAHFMMMGPGASKVECLQHPPIETWKEGRKEAFAMDQLATVKKRIMCLVGSRFVLAKWTLKSN